MSKNIIIGVPALMTIGTGSVAYSAGKGAGRLEAKVAAEVTHKAATMKAFDEGYLYGAESIEKCLTSGKCSTQDWHSFPRPDGTVLLARKPQ